MASLSVIITLPGFGMCSMDVGRPQKVGSKYYTRAFVGCDRLKWVIAKLKGKSEETKDLGLGVTIKIFM